MRVSFCFFSLPKDEMHVESFFASLWHFVFKPSKPCFFMHVSRTCTSVAHANRGRVICFAAIFACLLNSFSLYFFGMITNEPNERTNSSYSFFFFFSRLGEKRHRLATRREGLKKKRRKQSASPWLGSAASI